MHFTSNADLAYKSAPDQPWPDFFKRKTCAGLAGSGYRRHLEATTDERRGATLASIMLHAWDACPAGAAAIDAPFRGERHGGVSGAHGGR